MFAIVLAAALAIPPDAQGVVDAALADALKRDAAAHVVEVERVTWRDSSLGCPEKGMGYMQALVPGWRIVIEAGGARLDYHSGKAGPPFACPAGRARNPLPADPRT